MTTSFARFGLACALALTMSAAIAKAGNATATVTKLKGSAEYSMDGNSWQPLKQGASLSAGAIIRVAAASHVDLLLGEGKTVGTTEPVIGSLIYFPESGSEQANLIRITAESVVSIDTLTQTKTGMSAVSETQLDLRKGSIFFSVKKLSAGSTFEIKCPKAVAGVRGTLGWMNADGVVRLIRGIMAESYRASDGVTTKTQIIQARQMFDPATGLLQGIPGDVGRSLLQTLMDVVRGAGVPALPTTFVLDPNIQRSSSINEQLPGVISDDDGGSSEGEASRK